MRRQLVVTTYGTTYIRLIKRTCLSLLMVSSALCQDNLNVVAGITQQTQLNEGVWEPHNRNWYSTQWEKTSTRTNLLTGSLERITNSYTELANGLNYVDANGQWQPSIDRIELMSDTGGAAAVRGPTKVYFPAAIGDNSYESGITLVTCSNVAFHILPVAIYYFDAVSGKSALLATLQPTLGELVPPNQVVYPGAFDRLLCDVRYTYTRGGFESDLIIRERPQPPELYGLDPKSTTLQLVHTVRGPAPIQISSRVIQDSNISSLPQFVDETIDFEGLWFCQGKSFVVDGSAANVDTQVNKVASEVNLPGMIKNANATPVAKTFDRLGGIPVLIESVRFSDIQKEIERLPLAKEGALLLNPNKPASLQRELPTFTSQQQLRNSSVMVCVADYKPKGVVIDYTTISAGGTTYTFAANTTYFISQFVSFSAGVTFTPGTIIKYAQNAALYLRGTISCPLGSSPSIFTSMNEDIYGDQISGSTGTPTYTAAEAIWLDYRVSAQTLQGLTIRWAQVAVEVDGDGSGLSHILSSSSVQWCQTAVYGSSCRIQFLNSTKCNIGTLFQPAGQNAGYTGSLTDICTGDSDGNGMADNLEYEYFGRTGTLQAHAVAGITSRTSGHNPNTDQPLWSVRDDVNKVYQYNPQCWISQVSGRTAFAVWHQQYGCCLLTSQGGPVLITPRHAITVSHMAVPDSWPLRFVGRNNNDLQEVVSLHGQYTPHFNYWVTVLNKDVPSSVEKVRGLPQNALHKLSRAMQVIQGKTYPSANIPIVAFNQMKEAYVTDCYFLDTLYGGADTQHSLWFPTWGSSCYRGGSCGCPGNDVTGGDSGSPIFMLINNELALIGPWGSCGHATWAGQPQADFVTELNSAIYSLDYWATYTDPNNPTHTNRMTGYTVSTVPVDGFPDLW